MVESEQWEAAQQRLNRMKEKAQNRDDDDIYGATPLRRRNPEEDTFMTTPPTRRSQTVEAGSPARRLGLEHRRQRDIDAFKTAQHQLNDAFRLGRHLPGGAIGYTQSLSVDVTGHGQWQSDSPEDHSGPLDDIFKGHIHLLIDVLRCTQDKVNSVIPHDQHQTEGIANRARQLLTDILNDTRHQLDSGIGRRQPPLGNTPEFTADLSAC
ncbi:hypothetical protein LZ31DRAFT_348039 [Colletotrichum somersetense]|nr:hypothetical protein LZ31DRAFT_348039 [Colletotrichum somersetense]